MPLSIPSVLSRRWLLGMALMLMLHPIPCDARERQHHGVVFEKWVRDTFFEGYMPADYTQKWDIPARVNKNHGQIPVNPKTARYGSAIDLGDALRQFDTNQSFWLIIGYWKEEKGRKRIVNITAIRVTPSAWRKLWGKVTREDLMKFDALIKDRSLSREEVRRRAQELKSQPPFSDAIVTFNPKIDWKSQRRLQCGLRFTDVFARLAPNASSGIQARPELWGVPFAGFVE